MSETRRVTGYRRGEPIDLELVSIGYGQWLDRPAAEAFLQMQAHARHYGIELVPNSGHRDHEHQRRLRATYERRLKEWQETPPSERGRKPAIAAVAGWSDHEAGDAVDINRAPGDNPNTPEPDSPIDNWLDQHAWWYGFIRTVPGEPWHYAHRPEAVPGVRRLMTMSAVVDDDDTSV